MPAQAAVQTRSGDGRVDGLMGHSQQVIQGQQQCAPQLHGQQLSAVSGAADALISARVRGVVRARG